MRRGGLALTASEVEEGIRAFDKGHDCHNCRIINGLPEPKLKEKTQGMLVQESQEISYDRSLN